MAVVEGRNAVLEALKGERSIDEIVIATGLRSDDRLDQIWRLAGEQGVTIRTVNRHDLDTMSARGAHQGVVARLEPFHYASLAQVIDSTRDATDALIVVADGVTDPQNLGSMARTCEVAGAAALVIGKHRSGQVGATMVKTSAGATEHLSIVQATNISAALEALKEAGFWITGTADDAPGQLWDADFTGKVGLAFGSEGKGLSRLVRERCDRLVRIPIVGRVESLNVAAATAVVVYETVRQRQAARGTPS